MVFQEIQQKVPLSPDNLFFQEKEETVNLTKYYDSVSDKTVRGLFEILNNYNFTIDENTPIDQK
jgi:hypothetical protein